jgi:hypothetical protein
MNKTAQSILQAASGVYNTLKIPGNIARDLGVAAGSTAGKATGKFIRRALDADERKYKNKNEGYYNSLPAETRARIKRASDNN